MKKLLHLVGCTGWQQCRCIVPKAVYTVKKCSWGWANLSPETCRAEIKRLINEKVVASCWLFTSLRVYSFTAEAERECFRQKLPHVNCYTWACASYLSQKGTYLWLANFLFDSFLDSDYCRNLDSASLYVCRPVFKCGLKHGETLI